MIHMIGEVLGLHDPQFYGPGYRLGYYTTAQTPLPTGTGRTRLVSNWSPGGGLRGFRGLPVFACRLAGALGGLVRICGLMASLLQACGVAGVLLLRVFCCFPESPSHLRGASCELWAPAQE